METRNWILLRGLARGRGHWGSFAEMFQQSRPQDQFEFLNSPGCGERFAEESPVKISDYVEDLRQQSRFIKEGQPVHLLAVSLGGMMAVEWMRLYPQEIARAFLVGTSASNWAHFYERFQPHNYIPLVQMLTSKNREFIEKKLMHMVANSEERIAAEWEAMLSYSRRCPLQAKNVLRQLYAAAHFDFPEKVPGPVKIIGSHGDRLVSPRCSLKIAAHWGLEAQMHSWAGHDIAVDDPRWLIEQVL